MSAIVYIAGRLLVVGSQPGLGGSQKRGVEHGCVVAQVGGPGGPAGTSNHRLVRDEHMVTGRLCKPGGGNPTRARHRTQALKVLAQGVLRIRFRTFVFVLCKAVSCEVLADLESGVADKAAACSLDSGHNLLALLCALIPPMEQWRRVAGRVGPPCSWCGER
jgi:hypothetical protein